MAKIHSVNPSKLLPPTLTINQEPKLFQNLKKYLDLLPASFDDASKHHRLQELKIKCDFAEEVNLLERELLPLESPVVLCHNDLQINNIVYTPDKDEICFIDFEYSAFNFSAYDIAVHFCEYCGIDNPDFSLYPDKEMQLKWLTAYLKANTTSDVKEEDVHRLYVVVNKFALASHFHWATWALIQARHSAIDYDFIGYSEAKLGEYFKRKEELLKLS